jgi:hypothetical protein
VAVGRYFRPQNTPDLIFEERDVDRTSVLPKGGRNFTQIRFDGACEIYMRDCDYLK